VNPSGRPQHLVLCDDAFDHANRPTVVCFHPEYCSDHAPGQQTDAPQPQRGSIRGTVTDVDDAAIPGATLTLDGPAGSEHRTLQSDETGTFEVKDLAPALAYKITVGAKGFSDWTSPAIVLTPGQTLEIDDIKLKISVVETTVAAVTVEQLATQQVKAEEKQRVLGIVPNYFVVYDKNAVPMTPKLKYELAFRAATDVVSIAGDVFLAGVNQAADTPNYQQGAEGFGQRFGAAYADSFTNVMIGGAVLPSLLHQDPRYFYQGKGSGKSRAIHAMSYAIICKGDNGRSQFNYSGIGGNLIAGALTNLYSAKQSRTRIGFHQHGHQRRGPARQCPGSGVYPAQVYDQCQPVR
jgi:Carboxypeptidase regulatory-like domain